MAEVVSLVDDLDGKTTEGVTKHTFALDGSAWQVDLSPANLQKLTKALQPFIDAGRPSQAARQVTPIPKARGASKGTRTPTAYPSEFTENRSLFNEWLGEQGEKPARGRVSIDKANAFAEAIRGGWSPKQ